MKLQIQNLKYCYTWRISVHFWSGILDSKFPIQKLEKDYFIKDCRLGNIQK